MNDTRSIKDLFGLKFFIPSYQRGYRWDRVQVKDLLDDIWEFYTEHKGKYYCLQPIIVKKDKDKEGFILVDGQQRLTSIHIILSYLGSEKFEIEYEARPDSKEVLENIKEDRKKDKGSKNIDFYFMSEAYECAEEWFNEDKAKKDKFIEILTNSKEIQIIWHEIENEDEREVFSRINSGKIPLSNAELIKALFLNSNNFQEEEIKFRQIELSKEWDEMEYTLQNDEIWGFLTKKDYPARIELLFEIYFQTKNLADKTNPSKAYDKTDLYKTYRFFAEKLSENKDKFKALNELWQEIRKIFFTLRFWYEDHKLYHLIGYLIHAKKVSLHELYKEAEKSGKKEFENFLIGKINQINDKTKLYENEKINMEYIKNLSYGKNNKELQNILLLFNISTYIKSELRFSFHKFAKDKWSLEHINPQSDFSIKNDKNRKEWISEIINILKKVSQERVNLAQTSDGQKDLLERLEKEIKEEKMTDDEFAKIIEKVFEYFKCEDKHNIENLSLLSASENSKLSNHIFAIKKEKIKEVEKEGKFIPLCTKNVFMKYYSKDIKTLYFWTDEDQKSYINAIEKSLEALLKGE
ncbi:hypothetical protein DMB92_01065 [Campylobacter sp. MIT 99-7217]|uniref:DUF262 domain-containing protein n=1 Tax=Campylobacter sp. MIT 99-7217 TaxID=535091 RepID=UPI001156F7F5|nr:DUF262 domain-containing protein [Campylobacter sp. MIT 99-7217]TQR34584.1 hypothetical protein DMB92_01065 [Campylobacter sp. MIT 99-7217]